MHHEILADLARRTDGVLLALGLGIGPRAEWQRSSKRSSTAAQVAAAQGHWSQAERELVGR